MKEIGFHKPFLATKQFLMIPVAVAFKYHRNKNLSIRKKIVSYFYRVFTGGVSGLRDLPAQVERWTRQTRLWKNISKGNKDVLCLGDANLCAERWNEENFKDKELAEITHNFLVETSSSQIVKGFTRSEVGAGGELVRSCIDHCYTNTPEKVTRVGGPTFLLFDIYKASSIYL